MTLCDLVSAPRSLVCHVTDRPGHDRRYAIDDTASREEQGWSPQVAFTAGLEQAVRWYAAHRRWCRTVAQPALQAFLDAN